MTQRQTLRATEYFDDFRVEVIARTGPSHPYQDEWLADGSSGVLRVAAIDGVTPRADTHSTNGIDGGMWAARCVRAHLSARDELGECLTAANRSLYVDGIPHRAQQSACVVAADIDAGGSVRVVRACNCEAWVQRDGAWLSLFGPAVVAGVSERWRTFLREHPEVRNPDPRWLEANELFWGDARSWVSVPVGSQPSLVVESRSLLPGWSSLLLATDGFGSRERGPDGIDDLVATLDAGGPSSSDDVTALLVVPSRA